MKNWIIFVFISLLGFGCANKCEDDYEGFIAFSGPEDAEMLEILNYSFDTLLQTIYPDIPGFQDRLSVFLVDYSEQNDFYGGFPFSSDSVSYRALKNQMEESGFRKLVYIYEEESDQQNYDLSQFIPEEEEPEPTVITAPLDLDLIEEEIRADNEKYGYEIQENHPESYYLTKDRPELDFYMNPHGKFWYGLGKYSCSADIVGILELVKTQNRISLAVVAGGMIETDLNDPFIRLAVMAQFYIPAILRVGYTDKNK